MYAYVYGYSIYMNIYVYTHTGLIFGTGVHVVHMMLVQRSLLQTHDNPPTQNLFHNKKGRLQTRNHQNWTLAMIKIEHLDFLILHSSPFRVPNSRRLSKVSGV